MSLASRRILLHAGSKKIHPTDKHLWWITSRLNGLKSDYIGRTFVCFYAIFVRMSLAVCLVDAEITSQRPFARFESCYGLIW
jgi:hypothetical protein